MAAARQNEMKENMTVVATKTGTAGRMRFLTLLYVLPMVVLIVPSRGHWRHRSPFAPLRPVGNALQRWHCSWAERWLTSFAAVNGMRVRPVSAGIPRQGASE